ncbi:adenosine-specific kinase [Candidatus Bipolaricaulota bacterium]|nr:adenosine-specific kinase [Candidatus Bipolaricaulota bacterium]
MESGHTPELQLHLVAIENPDGLNIICGQSHFIKTVEDLHEAIAGTVPGAQFGVAFCEASGPCLIRHSGTADDLVVLAIHNAQIIGAGHSFVVLLRNLFPINVLNVIRCIPEVCRIYCATANPLQVVVAETDQGRGIVAVIDGESPKGIESDKDIATRKAFLRTIGYKL